MRSFFTLSRTIIVLLFILNISLLVSIRGDKKHNLKLNGIIQVYNDSILHLKNNSSKNLLNQLLMFDHQSESIKNDLFLFDERDYKISLKKLSNEKPRLIFKSSSRNCDECVDEQLGYLKVASENIGSENIIIITDHSTPRELVQFARVNQIEFKVLSIDTCQITSLDKGLPYFFVLDKSFSLKLFYIPLKGDSFLTQKYLMKVSERIKTSLENL
jgi:hypothetical protein